MRRKTRNQLVAVVIVALIIVIAVWRHQTRQRYFQSASLTQISYQPPSATSKDPYLVYTFSEPLPADMIRGTSAVLKGFSVDVSSPTTGPAADALISRLVNGVPFVPSVQDATPLTTIATTTVPASMPTTPISVSGTGVMWFVAPKRK